MLVVAAHGLLPSSPQVTRCRWNGWWARVFRPLGVSYLRTRSEREALSFPVRFTVPPTVVPLSLCLAQASKPEYVGVVFFSGPGYVDGFLSAHSTIFTPTSSGT